MVRLYKCLNEREISGYGSLNGLADEAVPLCGLEEAGVEEGTSEDDAGIISRDILMCRVEQLEWLSARFFVKNAK